MLNDKVTTNNLQNKLKQVERQQKKEMALNLDKVQVLNQCDNTSNSISSINQGLMDEQLSNEVSASYVECDKDESTDISCVKEAIIDLYLAIKIRSTEELDKIDDQNLQVEK